MLSSERLFTTTVPEWDPQIYTKLIKHPKGLAPIPLFPSVTGLLATLTIHFSLSASHLNNPQRFGWIKTREGSQ